MAVAFGSVTLVNKQPTTPRFMARVNVTALGADAYPAGGVPVPAALGSTWQKVVGDGRTIRSSYARGVLASGASDGIMWHLNLVTNTLMAYEVGALNGPMTDKNDATFGAAVTIEVTIEAD